MPAASRLGDIGTGHGGWPSRPNNQASPNVYCNSIAVHRQSDTWASHTNPLIPETHASILAAGSTTVFINGLQAARIGDPVACGSFIAAGSSDVFIGG